jgi:transcriptional regulator with XRE-family HTH domain
MSDKKLISPEQCRAARGLLDWSREDLAKRSGVSKATLADFETGKRTPYDRTLADIERTFVAAGLAFIPENGGGAGLRMVAAKSAKAD